MEITRTVYKSLSAELDELNGQMTGKIADDIRAARELGDLSENAEYHEARERQAIAYGRIRQIEGILRNATVVDTPSNTGSIGFGSKFSIRDTDGTIYDLQLVSTIEADPINGKVSDVSPVGMAVRGHVSGDTVVVSAPAGEFEYVIIAVN